MVVMSLSKVNSILPDKYQMALEPMNNDRRESTIKAVRINRLLSQYPEAGVQTEGLDERDWVAMRRV